VRVQSQYFSHMLLRYLIDENVEIAKFEKTHASLIRKQTIKSFKFAPRFRGINQQDPLLELGVDSDLCISK